MEKSSRYSADKGAFLFTWLKDDPRRSVVEAQMPSAGGSRVEWVREALRDKAVKQARKAPVVA